MSTLAEMRTQLTGFGYGTDTTLHDSMLNEAYRRICRRRAWSWLRAEATATLTPGTTSYTWANLSISTAPPRRLLTARVVDGTIYPNEVWPLEWLDPEDYSDKRGHAALVPDVGDWNLPTWWTRVGATGVAVWNPPDLPYTLHLSYIAPAAVLASADSPAMPRDYHDAIPYQAAYTMAIRQRDTVAVTEFREERDAILAQLEAEDSVAQIGDYEKIR